ncbi:P83/100 family protein [Treponema sp.]
MKGECTVRQNASLFVLLFLGTLLTSALGALEVDRIELEKSKAERVVFINYEGPHARIETLEDIRSIGLALGRAIKAGATRAGATNRYFAIHSVAGVAEGRLDADIFGLGVDAGVDHISNLRLILQGYLEGAYDYSAKDARLLSDFITIYNAVYRGNWDYFQSRYKNGVISQLSSDKAGLSLRFDEWPGRALIVIPLAIAKPGSLSALDTSPLTDKKVVDELRKDPAKGVETRKDMVDLKERESSAAKQSAELQKEAIVEEEAKLLAERAALEAEKTKLAEKERADAARSKQESAAAVSAAKDTASAQGPAQSTTQSTAKTVASAAEDKAAKAEIAAKEEKLAAKEEELAKKKEEAAASSDLAAKKEAEAKSERSDIAKDQQAIIAEENKASAAKVKPVGTPAVRMIAPISPLGKLVLIDKANGTELKSSALDTLNVRSLVTLGDRIIAIAGKAVGNGAIRLVSIDPETLEMTKQGEDDIDAASLLWLKGNDLYAISSSGGKLYLSRFDQDLVRKARSAEAVHQFATPLFSGDTLSTQASDGSVLFLNAGDLRPKK